MLFGVQEAAHKCKTVVLHDLYINQIDMITDKNDIEGYWFYYEDGSS